MSSNHLILCHPLLLLPSVFPSIRVFSNELGLHIRWLKYWSFSFSGSPSSEYSGLISLGLTGLISLLTKGLSRVFSSTRVQKHQFFGTQLSLWLNSVIWWQILSHSQRAFFSYSWVTSFMCFPRCHGNREQVIFCIRDRNHQVPLTTCSRSCAWITCSSLELCAHQQ